MTENELKQLYYLNRETERLQKDLRELELEIDLYDGYKGNKLSHTPRGNGVDMYDRLSDMLDDKRLLLDTIKLNLGKIQREKTKIERYIDNIDDAQIRLIFRLRHVNGMTWEQIGEEMNMNRTTAMRKHRTYLKVAHNAHSGCGNIKT